MYRFTLAIFAVVQIYTCNICCCTDLHLQYLLLLSLEDRLGYVQIYTCNICCCTDLHLQYLLLYEFTLAIFAVVQIYTCNICCCTDLHLQYLLLYRFTLAIFAVVQIYTCNICCCTDLHLQYLLLYRFTLAIFAAVVVVVFRHPFVIPLREIRLALLKMSAAGETHLRDLGCFLVCLCLPGWWAFPPQAKCISRAGLLRYSLVLPH